MKTGAAPVVRSSNWTVKGWGGGPSVEPPSPWSMAPVLLHPGPKEAAPTAQARASRGNDAGRRGVMGTECQHRACHCHEGGGPQATSIGVHSHDMPLKVAVTPPVARRFRGQ